ncbi:MAG TPA: hypothetical protein PKK43_05990 [Spirochaetota bacterium]|nr:hypothetical protein [Spirochaetota bacterium]
MKLKQIYNRLDSWRNYPSYQLERHIDIFSFYLCEVLGEYYNTEISDHIIPEFPINQKLTKITGRKGEYSDNIDFIVPGKDLSTIYFVELKTDMSSIREPQVELMKTCNKLDFNTVLHGLIDISKATKEYSKYAFLLSQLEQIGFLKVPDEFWHLDFEGSPKGYQKAVRNIEVIDNSAKIQSVFVQPIKTDCDVDVIDFMQFSRIIRKTDPVFSKLLMNWTVPPGYRRTTTARIHPY